MAGTAFSDFPLISSDNITDEDRIIAIHKDGTVFQNVSFEIGELKSVFNSTGADIYISSSGQDVVFGDVSASLITIGSLNVGDSIIELQNFSSSLDATFASDAEVEILSSSLESRVTSQENFSSSLDATYATDSDLTTLSSSVEVRLTDQENFSSSLNSTFATDADVTALSSSLTVTDNSLQSQITEVSNSLSTLDVTSASYASTASYVDYSNIDNVPSASFNGTASYVEYSNVVNKPTLLSGSAQISQDISGSFTEVSSSFETRITSVESNPIPYISQSGQDVTLGSIVADTATFNGNVGIDGTLTVDELFVSEITRSVAYASGSTKWGDTPDDTHQFTGSVNTSTDLNVGGDLVIDGDSPFLVRIGSTGTNHIAFARFSPTFPSIYGITSTGALGGNIIFHPEQSQSFFDFDTITFRNANTNVQWARFDLKPVGGMRFDFNNTNDDIDFHINKEGSGDAYMYDAGDDTHLFSGSLLSIDNSTEIGNNLNDTHEVTGSLSVTGSATFNILSITDLPTSPIGIPTGSIWNNGGALHIV